MFFFSLPPVRFQAVVVEMHHSSIKLQIVFLSVFITEDVLGDILYLVLKMYCFT